LVSLTFLAATTRLVVLARLVVLTTLLPTLAGLLACLALPALVLVLVHVASFLVRPMRKKWQAAIGRSDCNAAKVPSPPGTSARRKRTDIRCRLTGYGTCEINHGVHRSVWVLV
jgi:hypothetical protein